MSIARRMNVDEFSLRLLQEKIKWQNWNQKKLSIIKAVFLLWKQKIRAT